MTTTCSFTFVFSVKSVYCQMVGEHTDDDYVSAGCGDSCYSLLVTKCPNDLNEAFGKRGLTCTDLFVEIFLFQTA